MNNLTILTEFLLMDISSSQELQFLPGLTFLVIYLRSLTGNLLTLTVIGINPHLYSPMCFFIGNFSLIDICYISVPLLKMIVNFLTGNTSISLLACACQIFLFIFIGSTELAFLVVMSYDRSIAICHPLHYGLTITPHMRTQAAGGLWASGLVYSSLHRSIIFKLPFSKSLSSLLKMLYQYLCDEPQILRIASSDVQYSEFICAFIGTCIILVCSAFLFKSFIDIFSVVLRMCSVEAHIKALSTCTPQLAILLLFVNSLLTAVFGPNTNEASLSILLTAISYTMVSPFINPILYSLRNREINTAPCRICNRYFEFTSRFLKFKNSEKIE